MIIGLPLEIVKPLEDCVIKEIPEEIKLEVTFNRAPKAVAWMINDKPVVSSNHVKTEDSGTIHHIIINEPVEEDAAKYTIVAEKLQSEATVSFEVSPTLQLPEDFVEDLRKKAGSAHVIEVPFTAMPKPKVTWQWKGSSLPDSKRFKVDVIHGMTSLTMSKLKREDSGPFVLTIENTVGKCTFTVNLTVLDKPGPPKQLEVTENLGKEMTLKWVEPEDDGGCRPLQYVVEQREANKRVWTELEKVPDTSKVVKGLTVGKKYSFHVATINEIGQSEFVELSTPVEAKCAFDVPSEPQNVSVTACGPQSAKITWKEPKNNGGSPITSYNVELLPEGEKNWTNVEATIDVPTTEYTVDNLDTSVEYEFRVAASNIAGQGPFAKVAEPFFLGK